MKKKFSAGPIAPLPRVATWEEWESGRAARRAFSRRISGGKTLPQGRQPTPRPSPAKAEQRRTRPALRLTNCAILLDRIEGKPTPDHRARERRETAEAKAERIVGEMLALLG
ncbi:MAG: hypothetical protein ABIU29_09505 [Chthoniobacterales bacterium]